MEHRQQIVSDMTNTLEMNEVLIAPIPKTNESSKQINRVKTVAHKKTETNSPPKTKQVSIQTKIVKTEMDHQMKTETIPEVNKSLKLTKKEQTQKINELELSLINANKSIENLKNHNDAVFKELYKLRAFNPYIKTPTKVRTQKKIIKNKAVKPPMNLLHSLKITMASLKTNRRIMEEKNS